MVGGDGQHWDMMEWAPKRRRRRRHGVGVGPVLVFAAILIFLALLLARVASAQSQAPPLPLGWKSCSSTITVGGTAQNVPSTVPTQPLKGFFFQNPSTATESIFFDVSGAASTTAGVSGELQAGQSLTFGPGTIFRGSMSIAAATAGHKFICLYGQ